MYTRCSHCHTVCEVSPEALAQGRGRLPCAHCGQDFDALEHLTRAAPANTIAPPAASPQGTLDLAQPDLSEPASPRTDVLVDVLAAHADFIEPVEASEEAEAAEPFAGDAEPDLAAVALSAAPDASYSLSPASDEEAGWRVASESDAPNETPSSPQPSPPLAGESEFPDAANEAAAFERHDGTHLADTDPAAIARDTIDPFHPVLSAPTPSFIPDTTPIAPDPNPTQRRWPRWLAVAALLLVLIGQSIYAEREYLAADARWRPWLERACGSLGCTLPAWHDPAAMRLMTRDVRPHHSVPDALLISASFRNEAPWAQHWPRLHLSLSDLNGQTIAQREFAPDQYLGMTARDLTIQPEQTASVTLEVRDPGKQAVAFEFDFR